MMKLALMSALIVTLAGAVCVQFMIPRLYPRKATVPLPLSKLLPDSVPGWQVKNLPIADTELLQTTVANVLQYDDTVFREFTRGTVSFGVYISYWYPGKMSYYDVGMHTPDTCWVYNGWQRVSRTSAVNISLNAECRTKPAEIGSFTNERQVLHVAFWHLVGGRVNTYDQYSWHDGLRGKMERLPNYFQDFLKFGINQGQEQCFVRISSDVPIERLIANPDISSILAGLERLGLFERAQHRSVVDQ